MKHLTKFQIFLTISCKNVSEIFVENSTNIFPMIYGKTSRGNFYTNLLQQFEFSHFLLIIQIDLLWPRNQLKL